MKIFLIGYMGSGKTTVGKKLAAKLGMEFKDLDRIVEQKSETTLTEIFEKKGEDAFRNMEHLCLTELCTQDNMVVSTGGGTPCFHNNMSLMNSCGITVYLKMSAGSLVSRLLNAKEERPLIKGMSEPDLAVFVAQSLEQREPFYTLSQYKVKAKDLQLEELVSFIKEKF